MESILTALLSSAALTAVFMKLFNNHDRKKNHLIEEAKERRKVLREISRQLEPVKKYNKNAKGILRELKLCLNAYGRNSSMEDISDLLRDVHIWNEIEIMENEWKQKDKLVDQKEWFQKHKEKLLKYVGCLIEFQTEIIKKEVTTSYMGVALIIIYFFPIAYAIGSSWSNDVNISFYDIFSVITVLGYSYILVCLPLVTEKLSLSQGNLLIICSYIAGIAFYVVACFFVFLQCGVEKNIIGWIGFLALVITIIAMVMYNRQMRGINVYRNAIVRIMGYDIMSIVCTNNGMKRFCRSASTKKINLKVKIIDLKSDKMGVVNQIKQNNINDESYIKALKRLKYRYEKKRGLKDTVQTLLAQNPKYCRSFTVYDGKIYIGRKQIKKLIKGM